MLAGQDTSEIEHSAKRELAKSVAVAFKEHLVEEFHMIMEQMCDAGNTSQLECMLRLLDKTEGMDPITIDTRTEDFRAMGDVGPTIVEAFSFSRHRHHYHLIRDLGSTERLKDFRNHLKSAIKAAKENRKYRMPKSHHHTQQRTSNLSTLPHANFQAITTLGMTEVIVESDGAASEHDNTILESGECSDSTSPRSSNRISALETSECMQLLWDELVKQNSISFSVWDTAGQPVSCLHLCSGLTCCACSRNLLLFTLRS